MKQVSLKRNTAFFLALLMCVASPVTAMAETGEFSDMTFVEKAEYIQINEEAAAEDTAEEPSAAEDAADESSVPGDTGEENAAGEETPSDAEESGQEDFPAAEADAQDCALSMAGGQDAPTLKPGNTWFDETAASRSDVTYITFKTGGWSALPDGAWYGDEEQQIICYVKATEGRKTLYIHSATASIRANGDSSYAFSGFPSVIKIVNFSVFDTSGAVSMDNMFTGDASITSLDLRWFDTSGVSGAVDFTSETDALSSIMLGENWTGSVILNAPDPENTDGFWYESTTKTPYLPENIPAGAGIYITNSMYKVRFDTQKAGVAAPEDQNVPNGRHAADPEADLKDPENLSVFTGWYKEKACIESWNFETDTVNGGDVTLYAKWEEPDLTLRAGERWYPASAPTKSTIRKITFTQEIPAIEGAVQWKADESGNGGIICVASGSDLYVAANGNPLSTDIIRANPESSRMFYGFTSLTEINGLEYIDFSETERMSGFFENCAALTSLGNGKETFDFAAVDTSGVWDMSGMFRGCSSLVSVNLAGLKTASCSDMSHMFAECESLETMDIGVLAVQGGNTGNLKNMSGMFRGCTALRSVKFGAVNTAGVTAMQALFDGCRSLETIDFGSASTESVEDAQFMFQSCLSLVSLDLSGLDFRNVKTAKNMFNSCKSLLTLNLGTMTMENAESLRGMFSSCENLTALDVASFSTAKAKNMSGMFYNMKSLQELDLSSFDTALVTGANSRQFTDSCDSLEKVILGSGWTGSVKLAAPNTDLSDGLWYRDGVGYDPADIPAGSGVYTRTVSRYPVVYERNGRGRNLSTEYYRDGEILQSPNVLIEDGYTFRGWYKEPDFVNQWDFTTDTMKKPGITLYAKWTVNSYNVEFDGNKGTGTMVPMKNCTYSQVYRIPALAFTRTGYKFINWSTGKTGDGALYPEGGTFADLTKTDGETVTLYAIWKAIEYSVEFCGNGAATGSTAGIASVSYASYVVLSENHFVRPGYTFDSWNTRADGTGVSYANGQNVRNLTAEDGATVVLYAQWKEESTDPAPGEGSSGSGGSGSSGSGSFSGGGSSGSSGGAGGGLSGTSGPAKTADALNLPDYVVKDGTWCSGTEGSWSYTKKDGSMARNEWICLYNPYAAAGSVNYSWFRFNPDGTMATGWYTDGRGDRYYLNPASDGSRGKMLTGWQFIGGVWYYFNEAAGSGTMGVLIAGKVR